MGLVINVRCQFETDKNASDNPKIHHHIRSERRKEPKDYGRLWLVASLIELVIIVLLRLITGTIVTVIFLFAISYVDSVR